MPITTDDLLKMSAQELNDRFRDSPPGPVPNGEARGTAIVAPGTDISPLLADIIRVAWQGKTFDAASDTLVNQLAFGISAIVAKIYLGPSEVDQKDCIVLDYSADPGIIGQVRDEIRLISPQLYLGPFYLGGKPQFYFALDFSQSTSGV